MVAGASLDLMYPEVAVIEEPSLGEQELALAAALPERPLVLGGCCCSHVGAIEGLSARFERLGPRLARRARRSQHARDSPSGNQWGMPLRMVLNAGSVRIEDTVLLGARSLDPPEEASSASPACAPAKSESTGRWTAPTRCTSPSTPM